MFAPQKLKTYPRLFLVFCLSVHEMTLTLCRVGDMKVGNFEEREDSGERLEIME